MTTPAPTAAQTAEEYARQIEAKLNEAHALAAKAMEHALHQGHNDACRRWIATQRSIEWAQKTAQKAASADADGYRKSQ
jgi:hypothetical protein